MFISSSLTGMDDLRKIAGRAATADAVLAKQVFKDAQTVLNESKKIVPVDTAALKNSGRVEKPKLAIGQIEVDVTYGGAAAPYAWYVHEDPNATHKPGKTFKYLEIPFMAHVDKFSRNLRAAFAVWLYKGL